MLKNFLHFIHYSNFTCTRLKHKYYIIYCRGDGLGDRFRCDKTLRVGQQFAWNNSCTMMPQLWMKTQLILVLNNVFTLLPYTMYEYKYPVFLPFFFLLLPFSLTFSSFSILSFQIFPPICLWGIWNACTVTTPYMSVRDMKCMYCTATTPYMSVRDMKCM